MSVTEEEIQSVPVNVRTGCTCRNHGLPVNGERFIDPCCKIHYAELDVSALIAMPEEEITEAELKGWQRREPAKRRISYPKMTVAKQ
jgi:hypothetical protein